MSLSYDACTTPEDASAAGISPAGMMAAGMTSVSCGSITAAVESVAARKGSLTQPQTAVRESSDARHDVRTFGLEGVEDTATVMAAVWPGEVAAFRARFANEFEAAPERTRFYVAYADGHPAAAAWTQVSGPRTPFLGLWGGATLPEHRGRGFYRALVAARVHCQQHGVLLIRRPPHEELPVAAPGRRAHHAGTQQLGHPATKPAATR